MVVIFDWDGTLHNSKEPVLIAWKKSLEAVGLEMSRQKLEAAMGGSLADVAHELGVPPELKAQVIDGAISHFLKIVGEGDHLFPGAIDVVKELHKRNRIALYSNGTIEVIEKLLKKYGLSKYFDTVMTSETSVKPNPMGIELILNQFKENSGVMIDDHPFGILAAKRAGIHSIGVLYGMEPHKVAEAKPTALVNDVREIPLAVRKII